MIATDTIHAIPVSLLGGLSYLLLGLTDLKIRGLLIIGSIPAALIGDFFNCQITNQDNAEHPRSHAYPGEHQAIQRISSSIILGNVATLDSERNIG